MKWFEQAPDALPSEPTLGSSAVEAHLATLEDRLRELPAATNPLKIASLKLEMGRDLAELKRGEELWQLCRPIFDTFVEAEAWEQAAEVCDLLYQAEQPGSLSALGQGIWLGVTFPIATTVSINLLHHVVDDTPDDADGAAVAAATAVYLADLRTQGKEREDLKFFTNQILGKVAHRHSQVDSEKAFQAWVMRLELNDPGAFLVRLRNVVDVLVQDDWWIDREALQRKLPEE